MIRLTNYDAKQVLFHSANTDIYKGVDRATGQAVLLKTSSVKENAEQFHARLNREYLLGSALDHPSITKYLDKEDAAEGPVLVLEHYSDQTLAGKLSLGSIPFDQIIDMAVTLADILVYVHSKNLIHNAINPDNVQICGQTGIKLCNFRYSVKSNELTSIHPSAESIMPNVAYISPEQTGRIARNIDYRSDFYSLGCTLYHMATGQPPFQLASEHETIHAHIASLAIPPSTLKSDLPQVLDKLILKLIAKDPGDRYQNANELLSDLSYLQNHWRKTRTFPDTLPTWESHQILQKHQGLFGRDDELSILTKAFHIALEGKKQVISVTGPTGCGKSSLLDTFQNIVMPQKKISAYVDCAQGQDCSLQSKIFRQLFQSILAKPDNEISRWKTLLQRKLGDRAQLLTKISSNAKFLVPTDQEKSAISPEQNQQRLLVAALECLETFSGTDQLLFICIDNADSLLPDEVAFLESLSAHRALGGMLLIVAGTCHKTQNHDNAIELKPFSQSAMTNWLSQLLDSHTSSIEKMANALYLKSQGSPLIATTLLNQWSQENLIRHDIDGSWKWSQEAIESYPMGDDIGQILGTKFNTLSKEAQYVLSHAALFGESFSDVALANILQKSQLAIEPSIEEAIKNGSIFQVGNEYRFAHLHILETAKAKIPEEEQIKIHRKIGVYLDENQPIHSFSALEHLNKASSLITTDTHRFKHASNNLCAAQKALRKLSLNKAEEFICNAVAVLPTHVEDEHHQLWFECYITKAEILLTRNQHEAALPLLRHLIKHCTSINEEIRANLALINLYTVTAKIHEAVETGRKALEKLGYDIVDKINSELINQQIDEILAQIDHHASIEQFSLEPMENESALLATQLIESLIPPSVIYDKELYFFLSTLRIKIPLTHGKTEDTANAFASFASLLKIMRNDTENAVQIAQLAKSINKSYDENIKSHRFHFIHAIQLAPWYQPIQASINELEHAEKLATNAGDLQFASYSAAHRLLHKLYAGASTERLEKATQQVEDFINTFENQYAEAFVITVRAFLNRAEKGFHSLQDSNDDVTKLLDQLKNASAIARHATQQALLAVVANRYSKAKEILQGGMPFIDRTVGTYVIADYHFLSALADLAVLETGDNVSELTLETIEKFKQWHNNNNENFAAKQILLDAEILRVKGEQWQAGQAYDSAIKHAQKNNQTHIIALAAERSWLFWQQHELEQIANAYRDTAYRYYKTWGIHFKLRQLNKNQNVGRKERQQTKQEISSSSVDYLAINQATQAISSEMHLEALLRRILEIVLQSSGAQRGSIIIENNGQLTVEASIRPETENVTLLNSVPLDYYEHAPHDLVRYVVRTGDVKIFAHHTGTSAFNSDCYFDNNKPKSVLCAPITRKQRVIGALYLENLVTSDAFTQEHLGVLDILTTQAAISLENSMLYRDLTEEIDERLQAEKSQKRFTDVLENTDDLVAMTNASGQISYINAAGKRLLGASDNDLKGQPISNWVSPEYQGLVSNFFKKMRSEDETLNSEFSLKNSSGERIPCLAILQSHGKDFSAAPYFSIVAKDISEIRKAENRLWKMANYDELTGLPNRTYFRDFVDQLIDVDEPTEHALLLIDLDNFKHINDSLGHPVGDKLLIEIANILQIIKPDNASIARLGGDEFAILLQNISDNQVVEKFAEVLLNRLSAPISLNDQKIIVTPSIGIAFFPEHGLTPTDILRNADTAMFHAKRKGRNNYQLFEGSMNEYAQWRLAIESDLRRALKNEELFLAYQPKVDSKTQTVVGAEALVRWNSPDKGFISPADFIPIAEETGLIIQLGDWVLEKACSTMADWLAKGMSIDRISVNLSGRQFMQPDLIGKVVSVLERTGLPNSYLELEITESTIMDDVEHAVHTMNTIKSHGISLSIDDFGTGYSSLNYLKRFPLDTLKIDRSFVVDMCENEVDRNIALSIIELAHNLKMNVVAEGAETADQATLLESMNCDQIQGFYFSKPVEKEAFEKYFTQQHNQYLKQSNKQR